MTLEDIIEKYSLRDHSNSTIIQWKKYFADFCMNELHYGVMDIARMLDMDNISIYYFEKIKEDGRIIRPIKDDMDNYIASLDRLGV